MATKSIQRTYLKKPVMNPLKMSLSSTYNTNDFNLVSNTRTILVNQLRSVTKIADRLNVNNLQDSRLFVKSNMETNPIPVRFLNNHPRQINSGRYTYNPQITSPTNFSSHFSVDKITDQELREYLRPQAYFADLISERKCQPKKSSLKKVKNSVLKRVTIAEQLNRQHEVSRWLRDVEHSPAVVDTGRRHTTEAKSIFFEQSLRCSTTQQDLHFYASSPRATVVHGIKQKCYVGQLN